MGSAAKRFRPNMSPDEIIAAMNINNIGRTGKKPPEDGEKQLIENFKLLLLESTQRKKIFEQYLYLQDHPITHFDKKLKLDFDIQQIRFHVLNGDMEAAEQIIKDVYLYEDAFDDEQHYYYNKHLGNFHYAHGDYKKAFDHYAIAEKLVLDSFPQLELGDLYYSLGLTASQFFETVKGLKYTEIALKIYQQEFVPKRITECHINLGVIHSRLRNFKTAIDHNHAALKIGQELNSNLLRFSTEYNYGYIYFQFQNYQLAIEHISKSLDHLPPEYVTDYLMSFNSLVKASNELGDKEQALYWLDRGSEIANEIDSEEIIDRNVKEVYTEHKVLSFFLNNEIEQYENLMLNVWLPLLEHKNHLFELGYYYNQVGNYYLGKGEFEKAAHMLKKASNTFQHLMTTG
ncbi:tetratricopeptide repeat protein [Chungangia koreensis]|uniref:Tetratricopeptide repeat protein n=1 Tax=Chungangia koreensis TaxID=752657 RepID=A0ABV8X3S8_9LACT